MTMPTIASVAKPPVSAESFVPIQAATTPLSNWPQLRTAAGKETVDRRHAVAQCIRGAQLIGGGAQNRADRVAGAAQREHQY